ncbi:hypothetical protein FRC09_020178, partial [Ceratobasidium sp. 395]
MARLPYKCNICRSRFKNKNQLNAHTAIHSRESDLDTPGAGPSTIYECPYCHRVLLSNAGLTQHINRVEACKLADEEYGLLPPAQPAQEPHTPSEGSPQEDQSQSESENESEPTGVNEHEEHEGDSGLVGASAGEEGMGEIGDEDGERNEDADNSGIRTNEDESDSGDDSNSESDSGARSESNSEADDDETWDEMLAQQAMDMDVPFPNPHTPSEAGSNEQNAPLNLRESKDQFGTK